MRSRKLPTVVPRGMTRYEARMLWAMSHSLNAALDDAAIISKTMSGVDDRNRCIEVKMYEITRAEKLSCNVAGHLAGARMRRSLASVRLLWLLTTE
jgi:hypothetical protein